MLDQHTTNLLERLVIAQEEQVTELAEIKRELKRLQIDVDISSFSDGLDVNVSTYD